MRTVRPLVGAVGASLTLLVSSLVAGAAPSSDTSTEASTRQAARADTAARSSGEEFVVAFEPERQADAMAAIADAGGTVLDVTESAGVALVGSSEAGFVEEVRADDAISGAANNHSVGTSRPGMPHRFAEERPTANDRATAAAAPSASRAARGAKATEPLADLQWDMAMIGANPDGAWRKATGRGVTVGVIDTGVDASHPDIAPNFSHHLSRNFTMDIPGLDGETCEVATCIDPVDADDGGHGTHVAGTIAAARNGIGIAGVAPDATIVNVRAGQDSGYFFLYETVAALDLRR